MYLLDFKKLVVDELSSLHLKVDRVLEEVASLRRAQRSETITMKSDYNVQIHTLNSKCPLKSIEELKDFEEWLENENNYKLMVNNILILLLIKTIYLGKLNHSPRRIGILSGIPYIFFRYTSFRGLEEILTPKL